MSTSSFSLFKDRLMEAIKYDYNHLKLPPVLLARVFLRALILAGKNELAFKIASNLYRTGWAGSDRLGRDFALHFFKRTNIGQELVRNAITNIQPLPQTQKFFSKPEEMLNGIISVLKSPNGQEKGALLLNYSYYFLLFMKHYDVNAIMERYNIILEPSWAGFCEMDILAYGQLSHPAYLMVYEDRDRRFIDSLNLSLITLPIGPSWFVNHNKFVAPDSNVKRDIDVIMVASWARFKRHRHFFKGLAELKSRGQKLNIVLVGYPVDLQQSEIRALAAQHGVEDMLTIYEWIQPSEVAALLQRSKINIIWSKFEGNNRAIIEGMFSGTPAILREGHNYGEHYDFINDATGCFANERNLADTILKMVQSPNQFSPRKYVMENRNCESATQIMNRIMRENELKAGRPWTTDLAVKVNELHGMHYLHEEDKNRFDEDYAALAEYIYLKGNARN
ncbi:MAG TPA: glycosyltransferase [Dongiaceae bacterium]|nr:glycosyltransferase [Dongiaceae bacterium]